MTKVLENLYIGDAYNANDRRWLIQNKITHIINCAEEINSRRNGYSYLELNLYDVPQQSLKTAAEKAFNFYCWRKRGERVLVHCAAGISRSASIVIYILMRKYNCPYSAAYQFLKRRRPIIDPNPGFQLQLKRLKL
jgi:protein-tyrosine phosphatase